MSSLVLPDGTLAALTWKIPRQFGGMTKSLLQRSCQIAAASGREVLILTLGQQLDLDDERQALCERGLLVDGVTIRSLWEDVAAGDDDLWGTATFDPSIAGPELDPLADAVTDVLGPDGSLLARQLRQVYVEDDMSRIGEVVRTEIWDRSGAFRGGWHGLWPLWRWWLDRVLPRPAHLIVDSAYVANCLAAAPLAGVPTTYVVHNNHLAGSRDAPYGRLERFRSFALIRAGSFDAVVHLTRAQRHDMDLLFGPQDNAHVVPHGIEPASTKSKNLRPPGHGIVMANLEERKRIPHAIRAVAAAAKKARGVELVVYGRGPEAETIQAEIDAHAAPARLEGYTSDPGGAFASASYSLLTSTREGFGLVLVESMAAGCLPIAYDMEYGPADIITHGVDGFLVPRGDEQALAKEIAGVASASRWRLRRMRNAARRRAAEFLPATVIQGWAGVLASGAERARARADEPEPTLDEVRERERISALYRGPGCHLETVVTAVTWDEAARAIVDLSCTIVGAGSDQGEPEIEAELVHRPTGARAAAPTVEVVGTDPAAEHLTTLLRMTVDHSLVVDPLDHVVIVRARLGAIDVIDTPQPPPGAPAWLPLPAVSTKRPVLIPGRRSGLRLAAASPRAAATVEVTTDGVLVDAAALVNGAKVQAGDAQGVHDEPAIDAERQPDGRHRLVVRGSGEWKVRARINGRWRDVAWRDPGTVPDGDGPVRVELSPRGYVRLRRD